MNKYILLATSALTLSATAYGQNGNVGIGTTTPQAKLHVEGNVKIVDGTQGAGKVLTSDSNGTARWVQNIAVAPTIIASYGAGVDVPYTELGWKNTGSYITLPANSKYAVNINFLIGLTNAPMESNASMFVRTMFSETINGPQSTDVVDGGLISGTIGSAAHYGNVSGTAIIQNTTANPKTYYLNVGGIVAQGTTKTLKLFGGNYWQERSFYAVAIN